jgi:hypothetical protein
MCTLNQDNRTNRDKVEEKEKEKQKILKCHKCKLSEEK